MAKIRKLRGRWQAQVRRRGLKLRCKSFDSKADAEKLLLKFGQADACLKTQNAILPDATESCAKHAIADG